MIRVTSALAVAGLVDTQWFTEHARDKGTATHVACALLAEGRLDVTTVDWQIMGRVDAYREFLCDVRPKILAVEERISNPALRYTGTVDLRCTIRGKEGVLDLKPSPADWHPIQLAAYALCYVRPMRRWNLYISDDGRYKLVDHTKNRRLHDAIWRATLTLAQWRENGCKK